MFLHIWVALVCFWGASKHSSIGNSPQNIPFVVLSCPSHRTAYMSFNCFLRAYLIFCGGSRVTRPPLGVGEAPLLQVHFPLLAGGRNSIPYRDNQEVTSSCHQCHMVTLYLGETLRVFFYHATAPWGGGLQGDDITCGWCHHVMHALCTCETSPPQLLSPPAAR